MAKRSVPGPAALAALALGSLALLGAAPGGEYFGGAQNERSSFSPLPDAQPQRPERVALGRALFSDKRLSNDDTISCATCHVLENGGADGRRFSVGIRGRVGGANAPTVYNSALNFRQFWDGRAHTLEQQIDGPIANPDEMGSSWAEIVRKLRADPALNDRFRSAYDSPPTRETIVDAIATFERTLSTPNSPFDRYLKGEKSALNAIQARGLRKFESFGCAACHQGVNIGGNMFQTFGITGDYFKDRGGSFPSDDGRYQVTRQESDRHVFRVPSLRNVERTAPYFHDGSAATLEDAVRIMAKYQLGRNLTAEDTEELTAFLKALTGVLPAGTGTGASP